MLAAAAAAVACLLLMATPAPAIDPQCSCSCATFNADTYCKFARPFVKSQSLNLIKNYNPSVTVEDKNNAAPNPPAQPSYVRAIGVTIPAGSNGICLEARINLVEWVHEFSVVNSMTFQTDFPISDNIKLMGAPVFRLKAGSSTLDLDAVLLNALPQQASLSVAPTYDHPGRAVVNTTAGSISLDLTGKNSGGNTPKLYRAQNFFLNQANDFTDFTSQFAFRHISVCVSDTAGVKVHVQNWNNPAKGGAQLATDMAYEKFQDASTTTFVADVIAAAGTVELEIGGRSDFATGFPGMIDEVRVWSSFRSDAEITTTYGAARLSGSEPNLLHYWNFDSSGSELVDIGPGNIQLASVQPGNVLFSEARIPIVSVRHPVQSFGSTFSMTAWSDVKPLANNALTAPYLATGPWNLSDTSPANALLSVSARQVSGSSNEFVSFTYTVDGTDRRLCANPSVSMSYDVTPATSFSPITSQVTFGPTATAFVGLAGATGTANATSLQIPTAGATVYVHGADFGPTGAALAGETVTITDAVAASNGVVPGALTIVSATRASFSLSAGFGAMWPLTISFCGTSSTGLKISYLPPVITAVTNDDTETTLELTGTNFGPTKTLVSITLGFKDPQTNITTTESCAITTQTTFTAHTNVQCNKPTGKTPDEINGAVLSIAVGTGLFTQTFEYGQVGQVILNPTTGRPATTAAVAANSDSVSGTAVPLAAIIGAAAGVVLLLVVIVVLVVFARKRRERKNEAPFTPVDKKDFNAIIFGDVEGPSSAEISAAGNLGELEKILCGDDFALAAAIIENTAITEAEKVSRALILVFESNSVAIAAMQAFIQKEVQQSTEAGTLFRSNSMVSKMFKFYSRLVGLPYLYMTVAPTIVQLVWENKGLEVDPERIAEDADLNEMRWMLMAQSQGVLKSILASSKNCPAQFREIFQSIKSSVEGQFPESVNKTIGGFLFLRFFCPAVTSPESYGVLDEPPSPESRRLLILMTKVLQNLSNDVEFGSKEPYMEKMNDFIESNRAGLAEFFGDVVNPGGHDAPVQKIDGSLKQGALVDLSQHLKEIMEDLDDETRSKLQGVLG
jgi:GTPase-activator protein for Ras-like GTPase